MSTELSRLTELAKADKTTRFLSIAHLLTPAALMAAFEGLRKDAAGVDEVTYREYEQDVWQNIPTLYHRLVSHQYRAQPLRRVYIPKENGKERPISIPTLDVHTLRRPAAGGSSSRRSVHRSVDRQSPPATAASAGSPNRPAQTRIALPSRPRSPKIGPSPYHNI
jgi:hypothetical protein